MKMLKTRKEKLGKIFYVPKFNLEIYLSCDKNYNVRFVHLKMGEKKIQDYNACTYIFTLDRFYYLHIKKPRKSFKDWTLI